MMMWNLFKNKIRSRKPRILLLVDKRGWAYDFSARQIATYLKDDFDFDVRYVRESPWLNPSRYDFIYVFFWGETYYQKFEFHNDRVVKGLSSHRWEDDALYGPCSPTEFATRYLQNDQAVLCTSLRLYESIKGLHPSIYHTPNGYSPNVFFRFRERRGPITIGWAGNIKDSLKGYADILEPACSGRFRLLAASGKISHNRMNRFYNQVDVFAVSSRHEGEPLTLIEAMAAGCFPVCTDVGIVPELIRHGVNGYIVTERTPQAFEEAFRWCETRIDFVRSAGEKNSREMQKKRSWEVCSSVFRQVFSDIYHTVSQPKFRNDDVSYDTSLTYFKLFCDIFHRHGLEQLHGITLRGCTNTLFRSGDIPVEYEGYDTLVNLDNDLIRRLSAGKNFEERDDLIQYLNSVPDQIALHGLYHTDYAKMSPDEQKLEIFQGLELLKRIFPQKRIRYFIPPFNRSNETTHKVCADLGLQVLGTDGVHLESQLANLSLKKNTWYRYHHHRFYPQSSFSYYMLSLQLLEDAFDHAQRV